jgi:hypothetical protein
MLFGAGKEGVILQSKQGCSRILRGGRYGVDTSSGRLAVCCGWASVGGLGGVDFSVKKG